MHDDRSVGAVERPRAGDTHRTAGLCQDRAGAGEGADAEVVDDCQRRQTFGCKRSGVDQVAAVGTEGQCLSIGIGLDRAGVVHGE